MKRILIINLLLSIFSSSYAQKFEDYFEDRTLRIDYTFSGNNQQQQLYVDELISMPRWYGKRHRLAEVPLKGNGQIIVRSATDETVIYRNSFSTLFLRKNQNGYRNRLKTCSSCHFPSNQYVSP